MIEQFRQNRLGVGVLLFIAALLVRVFLLLLVNSNPLPIENIGLFDTFGFRHTHEYRLLTTKEWPGKIAVVADVTASMTPYNTQVMLWLKFAKKPLENGRFVFFNDGNNSPDALKSIGNTGGLHFAESNNFDSVYQTMRRAIAAGQGGDIPENNIEALLAAQKKWTEVNKVSRS